MTKVEHKDRATVKLGFTHGFTTTYSYTVLGQVSTVTAPGSKVWDYDYNAIGQPTKVTAPNTMTTEYSYDGSNRMTKIAYKDGATVVDSFAYGLTPASQITKITHNDGSYWDYTNDARGRLSTAVRKNSGGTTQTSHAYVYDAGNNMLSKTVDGALTTFAYTEANELTTQTAGGTSTSYTYDDWGQLSGKTQGAYSADYDWRYGHKLSKVTSNFPGEGTVQYRYRGDGRRHFRLESPSGAYTRYNYDMGWNVQSEDDISNNLLNTFTYKNPAAEVATALGKIAGANPTSGTTEYYFRDLVCSTRRVHAADKSTLATTEYQPYGDTYSTSGTQPRFTFTGKPYDATSAMYWFPYRYYSAGMKRWISRDPLGMNDGPNVFAYVQEDPIGRNDPFGLWGDKGHCQYAGLDHGFWGPGNIIFGAPRHFRCNLERIEKHIEKTIRSNCTAKKFKEYIHEGMDYFSHCRAGYLWPWTLGHVPEKLIFGIDADDINTHQDAYLMAVEWADDQIRQWNKKCKPSMPCVCQDI